MTYSVVAKDEKTGFFGIVVAGRFFAVGGVVLHVRGGLDAIRRDADITPFAVPTCRNNACDYEQAYDVAWQMLDLVPVDFAKGVIFLLPVEEVLAPTPAKPARSTRASFFTAHPID